ncbi:hypothetical protein HYALB_00010992 [Hymenoscyphus albidus]|uniref:Uncharacterized protein n=1 Tax=Hymenoscyphus albidus TaxID=595503 RepID=A0A9N9LED8_9HELO|nr:hypothetical protein HYALB_00010992 [Hymenoscyphus albidus]
MNARTIIPRMARFTAPTIKPTQRRSLSVVQRARQTIRSFEPHPFERYPVTQEGAKADWVRAFGRLRGPAAVYFPGFAFVLGWPFLAASVVDGHL